MYLCNVNATKTKNIMTKEKFKAWQEKYKIQIEEIRLAAHHLHQSVNEIYGDNLPYGFHLDMVVVLHNICGLCLGYLAGRLLGLDGPKRRAVSIEVGMQNSSLASSLATLHFAAYPLATIPGAIFSVWHNISGAVVARLFTYGRP